MRVLSLGGGVQSSLLLLMALQRETDPLDAVIFADTGWETSATYSWVMFLQSLCKMSGVPFHRVRSGNIRDDGLRAAREGWRTWSNSPPFFTDSSSNPKGMLTRACTRHYKIRPIVRKLRQLCGLKPVGRVPKGIHVDQIVGISLDEKHRARRSGAAWLERVHPLLLPLRYTRAHCLDWLSSHGYPIPPKSACVCCPYHSDAWFRALQREDPEEWDRLCSFDEAIREGIESTREKLYVHSSLAPIRGADLTGGGQLELWGDCDGSCGL